jgi:hypothetical protein
MLVRSILVNLYAASHLLDYIAHFQIMQHPRIYKADPPKIKTPDGASDKISAALQEALGQAPKSQ